MHQRSQRPWGRVIALLVACGLLVLGMTASGFAAGNTGSEPHPGADNSQSSNHGDCKVPGSKSDTHSTSGNHNGYDCTPVSAPKPPPPKSPTPTPTPAPAPGKPGATPAPAAVKVPPPAPASGVLSAAIKTKPVACQSRRSFTIHIRVVQGLTYKTATVSLNGRVIKTVHGAAHIHAGIVLTGLPRGTFKVHLHVVATNGKVLKGARTYHTCVPRRPHTTPAL